MKGVMPILQTARSVHQDYHAGQLSLEELQCFLPIVESQLEEVLKHPPKKGWPADAIGLSNRLHRHWDEWFTFLTYPEVKPDNNLTFHGIFFGSQAIAKFPFSKPDSFVVHYH